MNNPDIQEMRKTLEQKEYVHSIGVLMTPFTELRNHANDVGLLKEAEEAQYDLEIVALATKTPFISPDYDSRFAGIFGYTNGTEWPDVSSFSEQQVKYYESRLDETANLFLRVRYADFLFEYRGSGLKLSKFALGQTLSGLLLETASAHLAQVPPRYPEAIWDAARAIHVAVLLNNQEMLSDPMEKLLSLMNELSGKNLRWAWEISLIMRGVFDSKLTKALVSNCYRDCVTKLDEAREFFWNNADYSWHRYFCQELVNWGKRLDWKKDKITGLLLEIGKSYEAKAAHAARIRGSHMLEARLLEDAIRHYISIGYNDKIEELKIRLRDANAQAADEYQEISWTLEIPTADIEKVLEPYRTLSAVESLTLLCQDPNLVVDIAAVEDQVDSRRQKSPLVFLASGHLLDGNRKVFQTSSERDSVKLLTDLDYKTSLMLIVEIALKGVFDILMRERGMTHRDLISFLSNWPLLEKRNLDIIDVGIERLFAVDYVSAMHILVPQLEGTVRRVFEQAGYATTSIHKGTTQLEQTFTQLLEREDVRSAFHPNHHKYLQMVMVEQTGFNLRNETAHGLITVGDCNENNLLMVLHLFLILTRYRINADES